MRILVTNDDGIDSTGLHVLARALTEVGDVVVVAPDEEYSGYGAAFGPLHLITPEVHEGHVEGIAEAWAVSGPPALCTTFARMGLFGTIDLVVSGINPGANVGRSVYHSGTIGAALTARNGGIHGIAVSQAVIGFGIEGQGWDEMLENQRWETAGHVAAAVAARFTDLPAGADAQLLNVNVPNLPLDELKGWRRVPVGTEPPRSMATAELVPKTGFQSSYKVKMHWGEAHPLPEDTDGGAVVAGWVALTWLGRLEALGSPDGAVVDAAESALSARLGPAS